ncbi:MAG: hypothetical protein JSR56_02550 [Proteobacteria bacterium]|nr:hypothetical protein [Pseudomonadota bacterium]
MQPFCFSIRAVPSAGSPEHAGIRVAIAIVFVIGEDLATAEQVALGYVLDQGWLVEEVQARLSPTPQQLEGLGTDMLALLRKARKHGIAAIFAGAPIVERHDDVVEVRPLLQPSFSTNSKEKPN